MSVKLEQTGHCIKNSGSPDCMWDGESCSYRTCDAGVEKVIACDQCGERVDHESDLKPYLSEWWCEECIAAEDESEYAESHGVPS